jgi:hypothetical protein
LRHINDYDPCFILPIGSPMKYFTVEEANALLPALEPLMRQLLNRRARASRLAQQLGPVLHDVRSNVGGAEISTLTCF